MTFIPPVLCWWGQSSEHCTKPRPESGQGRSWVPRMVPVVLQHCEECRECRGPSRGDCHHRQLRKLLELGWQLPEILEIGWQARPEQPKRYSHRINNNSFIAHGNTLEYVWDLTQPSPLLGISSPPHCPKILWWHFACVHLWPFVQTSCHESANWAPLLRLSLLWWCLCLCCWLHLVPSGLPPDVGRWQQQLSKWSGLPTSSLFILSVF